MGCTILRIKLIGEVFRDIFFVEGYAIRLTASLLFSVFRCLFAIRGTNANDFVNFVFKYEILFERKGI